MTFVGAGTPATTELLQLRRFGERGGFLVTHDAVHGPMPTMPADVLLDEVERSGLLGRGGAAFPLHRKLVAVASGPSPSVVVANGAEGEPASAKDKTLLDTNPHLTLDGLQIAAALVGAHRAYLYVHPDATRFARLRQALDERRRAHRDPIAVRLVGAPSRFVAGEESAAVDRINGSTGQPRSKPPRMFESGVDGRPTLVSNVETLAHLAVIARLGAGTFRALGVAQHPGTMLFTVSGCVRRPSVVEAPVGIPLAEVLELAGGVTEPPGAILVGGYHGGWLAWPEARDIALSNPALQPHGLAVGAGVIVALPASVCGVTETVRVIGYLARESAGQCGPCVFGLPALAGALSGLASGRFAKRRRRDVDGLTALVARRGACAHPDGTLRFLRSSLQVFEREFAAHAKGRCTAAAAGRHVLPVPVPTG